jgi:RNA polymerase sigma-70 factor (ECF subfamily)
LALAELPRPVFGRAHVEAAFRTHHDAVFRVCMGRLGSWVDAEDATQEVFTRAVAHRERLGPDPLPWLLATAVRICVDEHRRRRLRGPQPSLPRLLVEGPENEVLSRLSVEEMLGHLTAGERAIARRKWIDDLTHAESGAALGLSGGTVRGMLTRARRRLRRCLEHRPEAFRLRPRDGEEGGAGAAVRQGGNP